MWGICVTLLCSNTGSGETPGVNEMRSLAVLTLKSDKNYFWLPLFVLVPPCTLILLPFLHFTAPFHLIRIPRIRITKRHTLTASFPSCHITNIYRYNLPSEIMGREDDLSAVCFANVPGVWSLHHPLSALFYSSCSKSPAMQTYKATFFFFLQRPFLLLTWKFTSR